MRTSQQNVSLSRETFHCAKQTSACLAELYEHLLNDEKFQFILPGKFQSDKLEGTFGKYRQMNGGNLYASVRQFLEADRSEKMKNLAKVNLKLSEIKDIFKPSKDALNDNITSLASEILSCVMTDDTIDLNPFVPNADLNILYYVAGCFSRTLSYQTQCIACKERLLSSNESSSELTIKKRDFLNQVNRGGLTIPNEVVFLLCIQAWIFYNMIIVQPYLKELIFSCNLSSQKIFETSFLNYLDEFEETQLLFLVPICKESHSFCPFVSKLTRKLFNVFSKNLISELNSEIHKNKKVKNDQKRSPTNYKVKKLQSQTS